MQSYANAMEEIGATVNLESLFEAFKAEFLTFHLSDTGSDGYSTKLHEWAQVLDKVISGEPTDLCEPKVVLHQEKCSRKDPPSSWNTERINGKYARNSNAHASLREHF